MSGQFLFSQNPLPIIVRVTDSTATVIVDGTNQAVTVANF